MITLTINGEKTQAEKGKIVLEVANKMGIEIPTLCHHELLEPYGACRLCTVEVTKGKRTRLVTACNYPVDEGINVITDSERVLRNRKMIMEYLLARCPNVQIIKDLAFEMGVFEPRFKKQDEKCILCGMCVRICDEVIGASAISFSNRGIDREVSPPFEIESDACIGCGACALICPTDAITMEDLLHRKIIHREFTLGPTKPIHVPFMQAVPNVPVIDPDACVHFKTEQCKVCEKFCEPDAINHEMEDEHIEIDVGAIILATGFQVFDSSQMPQYGYGRLDNVITSLEFERMCNASGPTGGKILLKDGSEPKSVGILHCIGSRDDRFHPYCSRVCCMYSLKYSHLIKEKTEAEVYQFYVDMRCFGKGYEEFYNRLLEEGVHFVRGKAAEVTDFAVYKGEEGKLIVRCEDTTIGAIRRIPVDMVILANALEAREDAKEIARIFSINNGADGFFIEKHPKLAPVSTTTDGVFIAGCCQGPKDIPDAVAQGAAAAAEALSLIDRGEVEIEPYTSVINEDLCSGCKTCLELCPYSAIEFDEEKKVSVVNDALCKGCGTCVAACPSGAATAMHFTDKQIFAEIEGVLA